MSTRVAILVDSFEQTIYRAEISIDPHVPHGIRWAGRFFYFDGAVWYESIGTVLRYRQGTLLGLASEPPGDR